MKIHEVRGRNMRDALERAREDVGSDAVVVSHRPAPEGGVQLAVAIGMKLEDEAGLPAARIRAKRMLELSSRSAIPTGTQDVERCMLANGASQNLVDRICEAVAGRLDEGQHPLDIAAEEIGMIFPVARAQKTAGKTQVFAFVGQTGVGKTTTIAKLGARLVRGQRRVAFATLDTRRVGAVEQLRAYAELMQVPLFVLSRPEDITEELARTPGLDAVLLDTTGRIEKDVESLARLKQALAKAKAPTKVDTFLVASVNTSRASLEAVTKSAAGCQPTGSILTKIDESHVPGPVLEHVLHAKLPVAFLSDGPDIARNLHRAAPDQFADLILRGRIS
jgi:flagellar biosynthesis protein FlhF